MLRKIQHFLAVMAVLTGFLVIVEPVAAMTNIIVWHRGTGSGTVTDTPWNQTFPNGKAVVMSPGATETFVATADAGSVFTMWDTPWSNSANGFCSGTGTCTITGTGSATVIDSQIEVFAYFEKTYNITTSNNTTAGSINPTSATVTSGRTQAFTITPNYGYRLDTVIGCGGTLSGNTYTTGPITADCIVSVGYSYIPYTITVNYAGTGSGTVKDSWYQKNFNNGDSVQIPFTSSDTFTATPNAGSTFAGWSGGGCSGTGTCALTVSGNTTITATFTATAPTTFTVTTSAGTGGTISPSGPVTVNSGATTSFTVTPNSGYSISSVSGCGGHLSGNTYTTGPITAPCMVSASFSANTTKHKLTVEKMGTGSGTVTSSPAGISCGSTCSYDFNAGTSVTLTAEAGTGATFAGWSGGGCSGTGTCTVTLDSDKAVIAIFTLSTHQDPSADNCKASLYIQNSIYHLSLPILDFYPAGQLLPLYYNVDFEYTPTTDGILWFKVASANALADTSAFTACQASMLTSSASADYYLFVPRLILGNTSYWLLMQYVPGGSDIRFKVLTYGTE